MAKMANLKFHIGLVIVMFHNLLAKSTLILLGTKNNKEQEKKGFMEYVEKNKE